MAALAVATLVVSPIINEIVKLAGTLIREEFLLVWGLKDDVEKLKSNLTAIQTTLDYVEKRKLDVEHLTDWLGKLKDVADDAVDILDTLRTEMFLWKRNDHQMCKLQTRITTSQKIKQILERLKIIAEEKQNFRLNININNEMSQSCKREPAGDFVDKTKVFGREDDKEKLINLLGLNDSDEESTDDSDEESTNNSDEESTLSIIPIIGMAGIGKTTLAQVIFNDKRIKGSSKLSRIWVSVSVDFNLTKILRDIIEYYSEMKLPTDLSSQLVKSRFQDFLPGKRFLLVLDDVWNDNYNDWDQLLQLLRLGKKGSKVILTSRSEKVAKVVGTQSPYVLDDLPENECWSLFENIAFVKGNNLSSSQKKELEDIGKEIVTKCRSLPLAIKAMGGLLRGNTDAHKWRRILRSSIWAEDHEILPALKLSYDDLPSHLKQCFAFCSIYPKAYAFDKKELVRLWMAQSFVQLEGEGQNSAEEIGADYFDELHMRSFFQLLNVDHRVRYRMHDLIHHMAQSVSGSQCGQVKDTKSSIQPEQCHNWRHVSLPCQNAEEPCMEIAKNSKKLRTLLLPHQHLKNFGQALDHLFHSLRYIRALDLSSSTLLELPSSIEECKLLRYLDLSQTEIKRLPNSICNLYNLQTLKLLECRWLFELPKNLGNLVNLCHLEIDDMFWFKCTTLPPNIGNLRGLHNLHKFRVGCQNGYEIRELKEMAYLTGTLHISNLENARNALEAELKEKERLHKVLLEWTSREVNSQNEASEEKVLEDLQPHSTIKELEISYYVGSRFPLWMTDGQLRNLATISLNHCIRCKILSLDQLPSLRTLYIKEMQDLDILKCPPQLRVLKISNCPRLSELNDILPYLRVLKIKRCASLKALPVTLSLMFLILVDNVVLEDWNEKEVKLISKNDQGENVSQDYHSFIQLLEIKVINCPKLPELPRVFFPQKLDISGCEMFTVLPVQKFAQRLQHLALDRNNNGKLLREIPASSSLYSLVISNIANIVSLPKLPHLPGLKALYIHNCQDLESLSEEEKSFRSLTSLRLLSIKGCQKLVTLPNEGLPTLLECLSVSSCGSLQSLGKKESVKSLASLKDLYIEDCPLFQSFPEDGLPSSLQHLYIKRCPKLTERCKKEAGQEWPKIEDITDLEIDFTEASSSVLPLHKKKRWYRQFLFGKGCYIFCGSSGAPRESSGASSE